MVVMKQCSIDAAASTVEAWVAETHGGAIGHADARSFDVHRVDHCTGHHVSCHADEGQRGPEHCAARAGTEGA